MHQQCNLKSIGWEGASSIDPQRLFSRFAGRFRHKDGVLCWGKAAARTYEVLLKDPHAGPKVRNLPALVICPRGSDLSSIRSSKGRIVTGEHPLPGSDSEAAGWALLEYFDWLRRNDVRRLWVFLSGGASSLAWIRPAHLSAQELSARLKKLYSARLSISELNEARSNLCALKAGGAARWLRLISPLTRPEVIVISDVAPYGADVVGSGPFWEGVASSPVSHEVVADNQTWVNALASAGRKAGCDLSFVKSGRGGPWEDWVADLARLVSKARQRAHLRASSSQLILLGGEPQVRLPSGGARGKGGRQTQIAAALAQLWPRELASGELEVLCMSSDGVDGRSSSAGAYLGAEQGRRLTSAFLKSLARASAQMDTATPLGRIGALLPERVSGTNVQDVVMIRVGPSSTSSRSKSSRG